VVITEPLGAETLVTFAVGACELVARCSASFREAPGSARTIYLASAAMHLFDSASGLAV
jgi:ABC-type sugar transport system ATPase subunit